MLLRNVSVLFSSLQLSSPLFSAPLVSSSCLLVPFAEIRTVDFGLGLKVGARRLPLELDWIGSDRIGWNRLNGILAAWTRFTLYSALLWMKLARNRQLVIHIRFVFSPLRYNNLAPISLSFWYSFRSQLPAPSFNLRLEHEYKLVQIRIRIRIPNLDRGSGPDLEQPSRNEAREAVAKQCVIAGEQWLWW